MSPSAVQLPLRSLTLGATFLSFAFGVIGGSVGLNALIKANQQKSFVKHNATPGAVVDINTDDVFHSGVVITVTCALIAISSTIAFNLFLLPSLHPRAFLTRTSLRIQAHILAFWSLWTFATIIPFDVFFSKRSAKITATLGGISIPQSVIDALSAQLGVSPVYGKQHYLLLVAILPWFALLFGFISAAILFAASKRLTNVNRGAATTTTTAPAPQTKTKEETEKEKEKESVEVVDDVPQTA